MENIETVCMTNPKFTQEDFNWEITTDNSEAIAIENEQFQKDLETFKAVTNTINVPEDKVPFILDFYDNIISDNIWNEFMEKYFKTKLPKNINLNSQRKLTLLNYEIGESKKSLNDVRYMTSNCERSIGWLINEDKNFANEKPEILSFFKTKLYSIMAKTQEEKVQIPFFEIGATLRSMECDLPYLYEYCFYKIFGYLHRKVIRSKEMVPLLESEPSFVMGIVRYRNSEIFGNNPAWNLSIRNQTIVKEIGYFTVSSHSKYVGNIWVDPAFRQKGILYAMFKYIKDKILPTEDFLFMATKNPTVVKALNTFNVKYIGKGLPYISENTSYELKSKLNKNYLEAIFCIAHKRLPSNEVIHSNLNNGNILYTRDSFPSLLTDTDGNPNGIYLIDALKEFPCMVNNPIKVICKTNDINVVPEYYNFYSHNFKNHSNTHIVYELNGIKYTYPCFDNEELFPLGDIHIVSKKIEDFKIDVLFNNDETIVIKRSNNSNPNQMNKVLFRGNLVGIPKEQIQSFFELIQYGIEQINIEETYPIKIKSEYKINRNGYKAVEIIDQQIKFIFNNDTNIAIYKNIEEVIKNFSIY